ncbi:MAG: hypothetical protein ACREJ0_11525, partial [Geminicoccaceae bacterium]
MRFLHDHSLALDETGFANFAFLLRLASNWPHFNRIINMTINLNSVELLQSALGNPALRPFRAGRGISGPKQVAFAKRAELHYSCLAPASHPPGQESITSPVRRIRHRPQWEAACSSDRSSSLRAWPPWRSVRS